ncbi:MAG: sirohydrochlorin chelatase, partial [Gammaproteobacteria bacterium]|nr:sirohydrochlorin chelatase [Gammaproteobacteria bacterium]
HSHAHSHNHDHSHAPEAHSHTEPTHHHAPYKHIGHPHGPRTMINENVCCCFMGQFPQTIIDEETKMPTSDRIPTCKK